MIKPSSPGAEVLAVGAVVTTLLFMRNPILGADNFVLPKTIALVSASCLAAASVIVERRSLLRESLDAIPVCVLCLGLISTVFALNTWYALAAFSTMLASCLIFFSSRALAAEGFSHPIIIAAGACAAIAAAGALLEAYGGIELSSRAPGGTIGNRNRMAHLQLIVIPAIVLLGVRAQRRLWTVVSMSLFGTGVTAIVLSRARGAWVAAIVLIVTAALIGIIRVRQRKQLTRYRVHLCGYGAALVIGLGIAILVPNRLEWLSTNPYSESAARLLDYRSGTGSARLVEYVATGRMIADHPILGVGPGNWRIYYPEYASDDDPNIDRALVPVRRFAQGEWVGGAAERGLPSALLLVCFGAILLLRWIRVIARPFASDDLGVAVTGGLTLVAIFTVGLFDPVMATPVAGFVAPLLVGGLTGLDPALRRTTAAGGASIRVAAALAVICFGSFLISFRIREVQASALYGRQLAPSAVSAAAGVTPSDYMVRALAAVTFALAGDCHGAYPHLRAAEKLYPSSPSIRDVESICNRADVKG